MKMTKIINKKKRVQLKIIHINLKKERIPLRKKNAKKTPQMKKLREAELILD